MSAGLNTLSGILFEDFMRPIMPGEVSEKTASRIMKITVVILGIISIVMVFVIEKLGEIYQVKGLKKTVYMFNYFTNNIIAFRSS